MKHVLPFGLIYLYGRSENKDSGRAGLCSQGSSPFSLSCMSARVIFMVVSFQGRNRRRTGKKIFCDKRRRGIRQADGRGLISGTKKILIFEVFIYIFIGRRDKESLKII
jgi:hypothetical protein